MAHEACAAIIDHVFASRPVNALTADVDPRNAASIRLLERLGFRQTDAAERTYLIGDVWTDSLYFGLARADWRRPAP